MNEKEREDLVAFLDGELDDEETQQIETKIQVQPEVRAEVESLKRAWDMLDYLPKVEPDPDFTQKTLDRVQPIVRTGKMPRIGWRRPTWIAAWAASLLVAGLVGFLGYKKAVPPDTERREMIRDLRLIENVRMYELVEDIEFLRELDESDLFGEEQGS